MLIVSAVKVSFGIRWVFLALVGLALALFTAYADPENFLVANFTFIRPDGWKWVWDESRSNQGNLLEVQGATTNDAAVVFFARFIKGEGRADERLKSWQSYFKEPASQLNIRAATNKIGKFRVVYFEMEGTYVRTTQTFSLIGATTQLKQGEHLAVRMSGPKYIVEDCKPAFRKMVEGAFKDEGRQ
jgi:hypothetical protein